MRICLILSLKRLSRIYLLGRSNKNEEMNLNLFYTVKVKISENNECNHHEQDDIFQQQQVHENIQKHRNTLEQHNI